MVLSARERIRVSDYQLYLILIPKQRKTLS